jgi:hypothetical protein
MQDHEETQEEIVAPGGTKLYPVKSHTGYRIKSPIYVLSVFVATLKQFFGTQNRIAVDFSSYLWKEDQAESNIWISEEFNANRSVVGKRPAILVGIKQISYPQQSLGDYSFHDLQNSTNYMLNVIDSIVRFRCISENMLSSLELATEVKYFISTFCHQISEAFCFDKFRPMQMGETTKIEEYKEFFVTDFTCELKYQEILGVKTENLRIKSIFTNLIFSDSAKKILSEQKI